MSAQLGYRGVVHQGGVDSEKVVQGDGPCCISDLCGETGRLDAADGLLRRFIPGVVASSGDGLGPGHPPQRGIHIFDGAGADTLRPLEHPANATGDVSVPVFELLDCSFGCTSCAVPVGGAR